MSDEFVIEHRCVLSHLHQIDGHRRDLRDNDSAQGVSHGQVGVSQLKLKIVASVFEDAYLRLFLINAIFHHASVALRIPLGGTCHRVGLIVNDAHTWPEVTIEQTVLRVLRLLVR